MLDNKNISGLVCQSFRDIPIDNITSRKHMIRESKIKIYDRNCGECGWKYIAVSLNDDIRECKTVQEAIDLISKYGIKNCEIIRSCCYPGNIIDSDDGPIYPTITEIVMNTCRLWKITNIEFSDEVVEDLIIEKLQEIPNGRLSEHGRDGKIFHNETVPESSGEGKVFTGDSPANIPGQKEASGMLYNESVEWTK